MIEGIKIVREAIQEDAKINKIVICEDCKKTESIPKNLNIYHK